MCAAVLNSLRAKASLTRVTTLFGEVANRRTEMEKCVVLQGLTQLVRGVLAVQNSLPHSLL